MASLPLPEPDVIRQPELKTVRLSDIQFDDVIYPRKDHDPKLVQRYADSLDEIEAAQKFISLSADFKLLDGKHRWLAYRKRYQDEDREIRALVYPVTAAHEQLRLAAKLNSDHGWQLTAEDKCRTAKSLYSYGYSMDLIAAALSIRKAKVQEWLTDVLKAEREAREERIFDLWMRCWTQQEIADAVGVERTAVVRQIADFVQKVPGNYLHKTAPEWTADEVPLYNVWTRQSKTNEVSHFGNTEQTWVDRLLYAYTDKFDVVLDPFAGGGSTLDVCAKRLRRCFLSDRKPVPEREHEIRQHDLVNDDFSISLPAVPRWQDVRLVYLDPPYWKQAEGQYSDDPTDLANMDLDLFHDTLAKIVNAFGRKLRGDQPAYIALIIQPTQWKSPDKKFAPHIIELARRIKLDIDMQISAPYGTQQYNAQQVEWAKANRKFLVLTREIIVWKVW